MDLTPDQIASVDPSFWAVLRKIRLAAGQFTFEGREYLQEPMSCQSRRRCFLKGTQGGASLVVMLQMLWGMIHGQYPWGVLYLMPSKDEVQEFSKSKFNPLITMNPQSIGKWVKSGGGADTASLKKIGKTAHLYMRSGTLPKKIDVGYQESSNLKSITVDAVAFDEIDVMDDEVRVKALGRMNASKKKHEIYIGNPGVPNKGIDEIFRESDQRHWFMRCSACGVETCAEFQFFEDQGFIKMRDNGTSYLGCKKCGNQIHVRDGHWIPDCPGNSEYMTGWRWSCLILPDVMPHDILHNFRFPPQGNLGDVMRTQLGMAYINEEDALTQQQVYACCGERTMLESHMGPCAAGVDVGDVKHVVIGGRSGRGIDGMNRYDLFKIAQEKSWDRIFDMFRRFNVKSAVVDLRPMADAARQFQARCKKAGIKVYLCEYSESTPLGTQYNDKTGLVKVNRTEIFDTTGTMIRAKEITLPRKSPAVKLYAEQMTDPTCVEERDKRTNKLVRRYRGKKDHHRNATNYFRLAADGGKVGIAQSRSRHAQPKQQYAYTSRRTG